MFALFFGAQLIPTESIPTFHHFVHLLDVSTFYIIFHFFSPIFPYSLPLILSSFLSLFLSLFAILPSSHNLSPITIVSLHFPKLSEHSCIDWLWPEFPSSGLARKNVASSFFPLWQGTERH